MVVTIIMPIRHISKCKHGKITPTNKQFISKPSLLGGFQKLSRMMFSSSWTLMIKLDLAFNNVKPKDWYFVLDLVRFRTGLGYERLIM